MKKKTNFRKKKKGYNQSPDLMNERNRYMQSLGPGESAYGAGGWILPALEGAIGIATMNPALIATGAAGVLGNLTAPHAKHTDYSKENRYPRTVGRENMTPNVLMMDGGLLDEYLKGGSVKIKPSKRGSLHKALHIPQGEKIPKSKLKIKSTDSPAMVKKKTFAKNFGHKKKAFGGLMDLRFPMPSAINFHDFNEGTKANMLIENAHGGYTMGGEINRDILGGLDYGKDDYKKGGKVEKVMHEFKHGTLHSGSKKGPKVKSRKQAIAIALSEQRRGKKAMGGDISLYQDGGPTNEQNLYAPVIKKMKDALPTARKMNTDETGKTHMSDFLSNLYQVEDMTGKKDSVIMKPNFPAAGRLLYTEGEKEPTGKMVKRNAPPSDLPQVKDLNDIIGSLTPKQIAKLGSKNLKNASLKTILQATGIVGLNKAARGAIDVKELLDQGYTRAEGGSINEFENQNGGIPHLETFEGPTHEQGGQQISSNAEVEGGETKYRDVVNSDRIVITKEIAHQYGLPKGSIGKTVAQYSKTIEKRYKGRDQDPFSMNSKEMELNNISKMSMDLAHEASTHKAYGGRIYAYGDEIDGPDDWINANKKSKLDNFLTRPIRAMFESDPGNNSRNIIQRAGDPINYMRGKPVPNDYTNKSSLPPLELQPPPALPGEYKNAPEANMTGVGGNDPNFNPYIETNALAPVGYNVDAYLNTPDKLSGDMNLSRPNINTTKLAKMNLPDVKGTEDPATKGISGSDILGMAPAAINAFMAGRTAGEGPDTVKLGRIQAEDVHPGFIDPTYALQTAGDTFGTANREMEQTSRKDYLRRRIQSATEETKAKSGILGQIRGANTEMLNRAKEMNVANRMRAGEVNLGAQREEEQINAANKGAWETARDAQLSNLGTTLGEMGRDSKAEKAQDLFKKEELDVYNNMGYGLQMVPDGKGGYRLIRNAISFDTGSTDKPDPYASSIYKNKDTTSWRYKSNTPAI